MGKEAPDGIEPSNGGFAVIQQPLWGAASRSIALRQRRRAFGRASPLCTALLQLVPHMCPWGDPRVLPEIVSLLPSLSEPERITAIEALGRLGTEPARETSESYAIIRHHSFAGSSFKRWHA